MVYPVSEGFLHAITTPHRVRVQASLIRAGTTVINDLPIIDGNITVDSGSFVRRSLTLTLPPEIPTSPYTSGRTDQVILTTGDEIRVKWGLVFYDETTEWVPVGTFRVDTVPYSATLDSAVTIRGVDRCADIVDDDFPQPRTFEAGSTTALIAQLIQETLPTASVYNRTTVRDERVPTLQYDGSRADLIQNLATSIGAVVHCDGFGDFIIRDAPTLDDEAAMILRTGDGVVIVSADTDYTRDGGFNRVVVRGESPAGDFSPVQGTITDDDANSPTQFGDRLDGHYGKITKFFTFPNITSILQAQTVGKALLAKYVGLSAAMRVSSIPLPHLEAGDSIIVVPDDAPAGVSARKHIVDSYTLPLLAGGDFTMATRDVRETFKEAEWEDLGEWA